jgi:hypothetical protein
MQTEKMSEMRFRRYYEEGGIIIRKCNICVIPVDVHHASAGQR